MPAEAKPLFRSEALRPRLAYYNLSPSVLNARQKLVDWSKLLGTKQADNMKETELLADFITDVFGSLLGYTGPVGASTDYTMKRETHVKVDGKIADAAFGRFSTVADKTGFVAALEGKGPRDPLDRPFGGRKFSAVDQALRYAVNLPCDWYLVTNLRELRLYHKGHDQFTFERFATDVLASEDNALRKFVFLLGAERMTPATGRCHLDELLADSQRIGLELTRDYYREYAALRRKTFEQLREHNPDIPATILIAATQRMLDRVLFIAFCEDRDLLPRETIARAYQHKDPYNPRPIWENFRGLFRFVNEGNSELEIHQYNGGLFATDELLERLAVSDEVCRGFAKLAEYEYRAPQPDDETVSAGAVKLIDVEILGHIFEQSISDLEQLQEEVTNGKPTAEPTREAPSRRKREGAFYTPSFVTRYIVSATLGPLLKERFEGLRQLHQLNAPKSARNVLEDPSAYDVAGLKSAQQDALVQFWHDWQDALTRIRMVDPACGSGAFLIEAFEQLFTVYHLANEHLTELRGKELYDVDREILQNNLFGVDLNDEAVEICRLSLWIKTAQRGKILTTLDRNIQAGNSIIADRSIHSKALDWSAAFPEVFADGGFDIVLGNPPYVRQEWLSTFKPYLQQHYRAFDGVADLYVYFYELGLNLLKPGGRLGFVVTNKWLKAGYGAPLRRLFAEAAWVESAVDFGHAKQIFPDADVFPSILVARKPSAAEPPPATARACAIPRDLLRIEDLSRQIEAEGFAVPRGQLGAEPWMLEPPGVVALMEKMRRVGVPLSEFINGGPCRGILTGFNDAFLLDTATKQKLVAADPNSAALFKPYLRGQDVQRWRAEWTGLWMLAMKSSGNHAWPWAGAGDEAEAVFAKTYPALHAHMNQHRDALIKRQDHGEHWWELRACAYWDKFDQPKVMYQEIQFHPCYMLDGEGMLANNKVFFIPTADLYLLGLLNSPLMWWHNFRYLPHMKDEAVTPVSFKMENLPIARPSEENRHEVETVVRRLIELTSQSGQAQRDFLDWLRVEFAIEKASQRLQDVTGLDSDALIAEVKKVRGKNKPLTVAAVKALRDEHARSVVPLQALAAEARQLERQVSDLVNAAYGLTAEEVALMWKTAPPRMPVEAPMA